MKQIRNATNTAHHSGRFAGVACLLLLSPGLGWSEETDPVAFSEVLTLEAALEAGLQSQPTIRSAEADVLAAEARARQTLGALLPQLAASGSYQRTTGNFALRPGFVPPGLDLPTGSSSDMFNFFNASVEATQLIYDFGLSLEKRSAAVSRVEAAKNQQLAARLEVALGVRVAYFNARAAAALVGVAEETIENQQRHLTEVEAYVEAGTRSSIDLAQTRTDIANAQVALIAAENTAANARVVLNQAMGRTGSADYRIGDDTMTAVTQEDGDLDSLLETAFASRPELAAVTANIQAQEQTVSSQQGTYWPSLSGSANFTEIGTEIDNLAWNWGFGLGLTWALYEGGAAVARVREAEAVWSSLVAQRDQLKLAIQVEVDQARIGVRAAKSVVIATGEATRNARELLRLAEARYEEGAGNAVELSDAQLGLASTQSREVEAHYRLAAARSLLLKALGQE